MEKPTFPIAVVMQRRAAQSAWVDCIWEPWSVLVGYPREGEVRLLFEREGLAQWLHPGFTLTLHRDETEGYYMNVSTATPRVFVLWRMEEDRALPLEVTVSYDEAGRWMDAGHSVDAVAMPVEVFAWAGTYVEENYRPEPKKRVKPRSFLHPKYRV